MAGGVICVDVNDDDEAVDAGDVSLTSLDANGDGELTRAEIAADTDSPAFTDEELHSLTLIPFQSPSRDLDALPMAPLGTICGHRSHD